MELSDLLPKTTAMSHEGHQPYEEPNEVKKRHSTRVELRYNWQACSNTWD